MLNLHSVPVQREEIFVERYDRLLTWSLQMTERDHELAEDLLHDLFIQFTLNDIDLQKIGNLDGYLYTMLRNLHLAQRRRDTHNMLQQLSIVEYDSAEVGLRTVDLRDQIQAQDELRRVCQYACARKDTAKIAGVLILRFFHGYYPEEIVQILCSPRPSVDNWLKLARNEAKAGLLTEKGETNRLHFMNRTPMPEVLPTGYARCLDAFLEELRQTIFQARRGDCFADQDLKQLYRAENATPIECSQLSHIVSCRLCLDRVNGLLGLPLLSERSATETLGRDTRKRGGGSGGPGGIGGGLSKLNLDRFRRRVLDTLSHKPQELCVSVNGYTLGSQRVSSERSELNLVVDRDNRISFVEVFTEQKIRLLMMGVEELPPDGPGQRETRVSLSDQRSLELTLRFASPSPTIQVVYSDPHFYENVDIAVADDHVHGDAEIGRHGDQTLSAGSPPLPIPASSRPPVPASRSGWRLIAKWGFWLRPQTVTAVFALLLLAGLAYFNLRTHVTKPSASDLLSQSIAAEDALVARTDLILHRTFTLEEREPSGKTLSRRRVEVWHSAAKAVTARRLYDENGRLLSGEWTQAGSKNALYRSHHASREPKVELRNSQSTGVPSGAASMEWSSIRNLELWQLSPSAKDFSAIIGTPGANALAEENGVYIVSYEQLGSEAAKPGVVKATLTLSRADLHANELTLLVRSQESEVGSQESPGNPNSELRTPKFIEYRFTESAFERRAPDTVAPSVFEPDSELLVPTATVSNARTAKDETTPDVQPAAPVVATTDLEVEVLRLLNQVGADMDDQTSVSRTSDGKLLVSGVVEGNDRRAEILHALATVVSNSALVVKIETVAEVVDRQKRSPSSRGPVSVQRVEVTKANIPVYQDLRRYLGNNQDGSKGDEHADEQVRQFTARVLNRSRLIMSEAGTLKRLAGQFSAEDLRTMSPEARAKWLGVMRTHARNCEQEARSLRLELQPIFFPGGSAGVETDQIEIKDDASMAQATARLFELVSANDRVIRSAFTISSESAPTTAFRSTQFWGLLKSGESLAGKITRTK